MLFTECIDAANVMRAAKLDMRAPVLERDSSLEAAAKQLLDSAFQSAYDCATLKAPNLAEVRMSCNTLICIRVQQQMHSS